MRRTTRLAMWVGGLACCGVFLAGCGQESNDRATATGQAPGREAGQDADGDFAVNAPRGRSDASARDESLYARRRGREFDSAAAPGSDAAGPKLYGQSESGDSESGHAASRPSPAWKLENEAAAPLADGQNAQSEPVPSAASPAAPPTVPRNGAPQVQGGGLGGLGGGLGGLGGVGGAAGGGPVPAPVQPVQPDPESGHNTEAYEPIAENVFRAAVNEPLSTFSIDVDTASYSNVRRFLTQNTLPPAGAVRIEEMVNYFAYEYPQPEGDVPFSVNVEVAGCPWTRNHLLARVALQGKTIESNERPASNLVFLLDVSGSMAPANKLPLVKEGMRLLVEQLGEGDHVAIVVYASQTGVALESTSAEDKQAILSAIDNLVARGSTAGGAGIQLAYQTAVDNFIEKGTNRVILCTDGDFNVGVSSRDELHSLIEDKAKSGVFLSVLGFGMGNYKDSNLELLADKGNGNYAYIDTLSEARKVLVDQMTATLVTIAKDVKIQVDFNPAKVKGYRLVGYENRMLKKEDFRDDKKDAGEIGAGHRVTALYEIIPAGAESKAPIRDFEPSKYQEEKELTEASDSKEMFTVRLRYKQPDEDDSTEFRTPVAVEEPAKFDSASDDFQFAASVAEFGMLLRNSEHKGDANYPHVEEVAAATVGPDPFGYRAEFLELVKKARALAQGGGR